MVFLNDGLTNLNGTCFLATAVQSLTSAFSNLPITIALTTLPAEQRFFSTLLFQLIELLKANEAVRDIRAHTCNRLFTGTG